MAFDAAFYYYTHFSQFIIDADCTYDSTDQSLTMNNIRSIIMKPAGCDEHHHGIVLPDVRAVSVDEYPGFWVVRIGSPKTIWLPDEKSHMFMRNDLKHNHNMMAYWDYRSIALVTDVRSIMVTFQKFLENITNVTYDLWDGILIS